MKPQIPNGLNTCRPLSLFSYKPDSKIGKTPIYMKYSLKVDIKTKPGDKERKMVTIYVTLFRTGSPEALLKFITVPGSFHRTPEVRDDPQPLNQKSAPSF